MAPPLDDPQQPMSEAEAFGRRQEEARQRRLQAAFQQTTDTSADQAAEARRLSNRLGVPQSVVERNLPAYQRQNENVRPYGAMADQSPHLSRWLENPDNAKVAKDDLEPLGLLEWLVTAPQRAFQQGVDQLRYGDLRYQSIFRDLTQAEKDQLETTRYGMESGGRLGVGEPDMGSSASIANYWFRGAVTGGAQQLPILFGAGLAAAKRGVQGAIAGGAMGAAGGSVLGPVGMGLSTAAGVGAGFTIGATAGAWGFSAKMEAGLAYDEYLGYKDEHGQPIDPQVAKAAALAVGAFNATLETGGEVLLAKTFAPVVRELTGSLTRSAVREALRVPTVRAALGEAVKSYAGALTGNVAEEVGQRAATILGGELAKMRGRGTVAGQLEPGNIDLYTQPAVRNADGSVSTVDSLSLNIDGKETLLPTVTRDGRHLANADEALAEYQRTRLHLGKFDSPEAATAFAEQLHRDYEAGVYSGKTFMRSASTIASDLFNEAAGAFQGLALTVLPGPMLSAAIDSRRARQAQQNQQWFKALDEGVKQSKTVARTPGAAIEMLAQATEDGPIKDTYIPAAAAGEYLQEKGIDPVEFFTLVTGKPTAYSEALELGQDIKVPTADYAVKVAGTAHHAFFEQIVRLGDPEAWNVRDVEAYKRKVLAEVEAERATVKEPTPYEQMVAFAETKMRERGIDPRQAPAVAKLWADANAQLALMFQQDPMAFWAERGVTAQAEVRGQAVTGVTRVTQPDTVAAQQTAKPGKPVTDTETPPKEAPATEKPGGKAVFAYHDPNTGGPNYMIIQGGGGYLRSNVTTARLEELGIEIPETPPEDFQETPDARRERMRAAMRAVEAPAVATVQKAAEAAQTPPAAVLARLADAAPVIEEEANQAVRGAVDPDAPLDLSDPVAAARLMRLENPAIDREAKALAERSRASRKEAPPRAKKGATSAEAATAEAREGIPDDSGEQRAPGAGGPAAAAGPGAGAELRGLPTPAPRGIPELDEVYQPEPRDVTAARLTPEVVRELERVLEEMQTFRYEPEHWDWDVERLEGNAAGGHAQKTPARGGAPVYEDVLGYSPVNLHRGKPAAMARGSRAQVEAAIAAVLEHRDVQSNLQEGALRVAENRNAGNWRDLTPPSLPPRWGDVASRSMTDALQADLAAAVEANTDPDRLEVTDDQGDTSFDVETLTDDFLQTLFDAGLGGGHYDVVETAEERRVREQRGYTELVRVDAARFRARYEQDQNEQLPWNAGRQQRLEALTVPVSGYPIVSVTPPAGLVAVGDGRHRITVASSRGQTIDVAVQPGTQLPADVLAEGIVDRLDTGELQPRVPGAEAARQVGKAATAFRAPVQATAQDFELTAEGAPLPAIDQGELFQLADAAERVANVSALDAMMPVAQAGQFATRRDLKLEMQRRVQEAAKAAGVNLDPATPEGHAYLVSVALRDALTSLQTNANAVGWYNQKTRQALAIAATIYPELANDVNARFAFTFALAIHSNGLAVNQNFVIADQAYRAYRRTGKMPTNLGIGAAAQQMRVAAQFFNTKAAEWGVDTLRRFMVTEFTIAELRRLGLDPDGEAAGVVVRGAAVIGPKIGNGFFSNLNGHFDALTMDRWLMRTWGRWRGQLFDQNDALVTKKRGELKTALATMLRKAPAQARLFSEAVGKDVSTIRTTAQIDQLGKAIRAASADPQLRARMAASALGDELRRHGNMLGAHLDGQKEAPDGPVERSQIRAVFADMLAELHQLGYTGMTTADQQAVLWYAERRLYDMGTSSADVSAGYEDLEAPDYANAAAALARSKGIDQDVIDRAVAGATAGGTLADGRPGGVSGGAGAEPAAAAVGGAAGRGSQPGRGFSPEAREAFLTRYAAPVRNAKQTQLAPTLERELASDELYQLDDTPFYSRLTAAVERSTQPKASGAQWKATIKNSKLGINRDEFALAHVDDLEDGKVYTRAEVLDYLAANTLQPQIVRLAPVAISEHDVQARADEIHAENVAEAIAAREDAGESPSDLYVIGEPEAVEQEDGWWALLNDEDVGGPYETEEAALLVAQDAYRQEDERREEEFRRQIANGVRYVNAERQARDELEARADYETEPTHFDDYVLPGLEKGSYQEQFLTVPNLPALARDPIVTYAEAMTSVSSDGTVEHQLQVIVNGKPVLDRGGRPLLVSVPGDYTEAQRITEIHGWLEDLGFDFDAAPRWFDGHQQYDDIENPIVRVRSGIRTTTDGQRVLFLEEVQPPQQNQQKHMPPLLLKNWREIAFKHALRDAVDRGLAGVSWTTGQQQADRYSLEKKVETIQWGLTDEGSVLQQQWGAEAFVSIDMKGGTNLRLHLNDQGIVLQTGSDPNVAAVAGHHLSEVVGKEVAEAILAKPAGSLEGPDLAIGGKGLKRLYDVDFTNVVNGLPAVKKHGGKVETRAMLVGALTPQQYRIEDVSEFRTPQERTVEQNREVDKIDELIDRVVATLGDREWADVPLLHASYLALLEKRHKTAEGDRQFRVTGQLPGMTQRVNFDTRAEAEAYVRQQTQSDQPYLAITPSMREAIKEGQALFQDEDDPAVPPAGWDRLEAGPEKANLPPGPLARGSYNRQHRIIRLFENANPSTILHETGHYFLELMCDLAILPEAPPKLVADTLTLLRFGGWTGDLATWHTLSTDARRDVHETVARGFEAYLFEGKAPSRSLRESFSQFRAWLLGVYRTIKALRVDLTPEVRGVFDRLLASENAIAQAEQDNLVQPMFLTAEQAGMTAQEFARYAQKVGEAGRTAREKLDRQLLEEVRREQTRVWQQQRDGIREQVVEELAALPLYRALAAVRRGLTPTGQPLIEGETAQPLKLSRDLILDRYGKEALKALPRGVYQAAGGLDPDLIAETYGFSSGAAMLNDFSASVPFSQAVENETGRRMLEQHGSLLLDGSLVAEAQTAVANEDREVILRAELRALARLRQLEAPVRTAVRDALQEAKRERDYERRWFEAETKLRIAMAEGHQQIEIDRLAAEVRQLRQQARGGAAAIRAALPPAEVIRDTARIRIAATRIGDLTPERFWAAANQASREATEHAARQDLDAAIVAKQKELMNLALYREGQRVLREVETRTKAAKALDTPNAKKRLGLAGQSFPDQVAGILDRYEFARATQEELERRSDIREWAAHVEGMGLPVDLPEAVLREARRINYRQLTVEEFMGVTDALAQIAHLARLSLNLLTAERAARLEEITTNLATSIAANVTRDRQVPIGDRRPKEDTAHTVADFFAGHRKLSNLLRELDGWQDGGPATSAIMFTLDEAGNREAQMLADSTAAMSELVDRAFPGMEKHRLYALREIPAIGKSLSRMQAIQIALNWGNETSRQRVRDGFGWSNEQVQAVLDTLSAGDLQFVQDVIDHINSWWPQIEAKQRRVYGVAPEKVEAVEIKAKNGTIAGGYFPLKYDDRLSAGAIKNLDLEAANAARMAAYTQATTKRGHTQGRLDIVRDHVIRTDFGVIFEHLQQVIHDLSHHEALVDVGRILSDRKVSKAIVDHYGDVFYKQMRGAIRDVAFGAVPAASGIERAVNHARQGATVVGLGWRFTTAALQPLGLTNSMFQIGPKWVGRGIMRWLRGPEAMESTIEWIYARSTMMQLRGQTMNRELNEVRQQFGVNTGKLSGWIAEALSTVTNDLVTQQGIADSYFRAIQIMQTVADVPTWLGAYEKAMEAGEGEERSVQLADRAVLDSQGGGQIKDLAQVQRGNPWQKLWTNFYSFFNLVHQQHLEAHGRARTSVEPWKVGRLACDYLLLFVVPATLGTLMKDAMRPGDDSPDDESWGEWAAELAGQNLSYFAGTMLGMREIAAAIEGTFGYEGPAGARVFSTMTRLVTQIKQGEFDAQLFREALNAAGILFHVPTGQVWTSLSGITALIEGKTQNPMAAAVGPPKEKR